MLQQGELCCSCCIIREGAIAKPRGIGSGIGVAGYDEARCILCADLDFLDVREVEFDIVKVKTADKKKVVYVIVVVKEPKKVKVKSLKNNKKNAFTIKWKKVKKASGYFKLISCTGIQFPCKLRDSLCLFGLT